MKQGRTLQELVIEIDRQNNAKRDFVAPGRALKVETIGSGEGGTLHSHEILIMNNGDEFGMRETFHNQLAESLEIPKQYYQRLRSEAPELYERNVNHWLREQ